MVCKSVVRALSVQEADFPKVRQGERPWQSLTYFDTETDRDPQSVTVLIDRQVAPDTLPTEFGQPVVAVFRIEQVARAVTRTDREDRSRTYESVSNQFRARVIAFEPVPATANGGGSASQAKPAAKAA